MKILKAWWFSPMMTPHFGVVVGVDEITKEKKAYIGPADGLDEESDTRDIAARGAKLRRADLEEILEAMKDEK